MSRPTTGCIEWTGRRDSNGYGRLGGAWAHRQVYEQHHGPIPARMEIDHLCSNPPCVNPEHLEAVTRAEHCARTMMRLGKDDLHLSAAYLRSLGMTYSEIADALGYSARNSASSAVRAAITKGLVSPDEVPTVSRLSDSDCVDIRALRAIGVPVREIASWYGIHESQVSRVSRGLTNRRGAAK